MLANSTPNAACVSQKRQKRYNDAPMIRHNPIPKTDMISGDSICAYSEYLELSSGTPRSVLGRVYIYSAVNTHMKVILASLFYII
jgi:hypothetical protein